MLGVLYGFAVILGNIGAGYLAAVGGVVKGDQRRVLGAGDLVGVLREPGARRGVRGGRGIRCAAHS